MLSRMFDSGCTLVLLMYLLRNVGVTLNGWWRGRISDCPVTMGDWPSMWLRLLLPLCDDPLMNLVLVLLVVSFGSEGERLSL